MRKAQEWSGDCDLFIAIGSSLVVWPAAGFPLQAKKSGARLVIVNREPTEFDSIADLVIRQDIGDALSPIIAHWIRQEKLLHRTFPKFIDAREFSALPNAGQC